MRTKPEPFHRSILFEIRRAESSIHLKFLANIIKTTQIPTGHDKIVEAWREQMVAFGMDMDLGVPAAVLSQKPDRSKMGFAGVADSISEEVLAMSEEELNEYIEEHNLGYLLDPKRIQRIFDEAMENPAKAQRLMLIWDKDKLKDGEDGGEPE